MTTAESATMGALQKRPRTAQTAGGRTQELSTPMPSAAYLRLPLSGTHGRGLVALIDVEQAELVIGRAWLLHRSRDGVYARNAEGEFLHRVVLGIASGDPRRVDHINGDALDCRRSNLRVATTAENAQNQGSRGGSSRYRGVAWDRSRGKWAASAMLNGRRTTIGRFETEDEAGEAAARWRRQHMPFSEEAA